MSETKTSDTTNQTCPGFFRRPKVKQSLCKLFLVFNLTRVFNILETITGIGGITVRKPKCGDGVGWMIDGSDLEVIPDEVSIEKDIETDKTQVVNFPETGIRTVGITDVLSSDITSGKLKANHASQYDLLVRVKNYDGSKVAMGYMPIGDNPTGEDPDGTGDNGGGTVDDWCQHLNDPDGGGGSSGSGTDNGHLPDGNPDSTDGSGGGDTGDHSDGGSHPGKSGPCW